MKTMQEPVADKPSLEGLVESGILTLDSLHPGGLALTLELIQLCGIQKGAKVLDVASGTGETACFLAERLAARVYGVDRSDQMIQQSGAKARAKGLNVEFVKADATRLPFGDGMFDAAICECTLCFLDKERVLREMARVVRHGGCIGMHDLCWKEGAPDNLKRTLAEFEGEKPETLAGWQRLFEQAGLVQVKVVDKSTIKSRWMKESRRQLGLAGQLHLGLWVIRRWGIRGLLRIFLSERVFSSECLGYGIVIGTRP